MADKVNNLQDLFLNSLRRSKTPVTMFLVKGVKLQGVITWFDAFSLLLRREGTSQLVYKHSISTIMPSDRADMSFTQHVPSTGASGRAALQDLFLAAAAREHQNMTVFLVNGVRMKGAVAGYDQFALLLERGDQVQLIYKHAVSNLHPATPLNLDQDGPGSEDEAP